MPSDRKFSRTERDKYTLEEKNALGQLCKRYKAEYETTAAENSQKVNFNEKRRKHVKTLPRGGYLARAVRGFYSELKDAKHNDPSLTKAIKLGKRCLEQIEEEDKEGAITAPPSKSKYRQPGGGRKVTIPDVRQALFEWFIDIRGTLKARLPRKMFKTQCHIFYEQWLAQQPEEVPEEKRIIFSNRWIKNWMSEYGVSLRHPNKRFQIKQADREERVFEYLKNIWTVRKYFIDNFGVDPPVINGDQMPLHRNESSSQKTLNFTGMDTYVKENYTLSRERVTVFTQACSDPKVTLKPEFVFKGKGTRTKLNPPEDMKFQWAPKGSYRLEQMLSTIANLPNRYNIFTHKNYAIYVLDDYSVHLMPEIKAALLKKGYIFVGIGGGVTGDIQINDTDIHSPLKANYRELEQKLMIEQLRLDPKKIPQPSRDHMMQLLLESWNSLEIDTASRFRALWVTNALDGSEDYLVSERIFALVGEKLKAFRSRLMQTPSPKNLKDLQKLITPPKGVKRKQENETSGTSPQDEGDELFDCEGEIISINQQNEELLSEEEDANDEADDAERQDENDQANTDNASSSNVVLLAEMCEDNDDLRKDAVFIDELGKLLSNAETSNLFLPHLTKFRRSYITARRSVKRRIENKLNNNPHPEADLEAGDDEQEADGDEQHDDDSERNLFESLFQ